MRIQIFDSTKTEVYKWEGYWANKEANTENVYLTGGTYYLCLTYEGNDISFLVTADSVSETFKETQDDDDNTFSDANSIDLNKKYKGVLCQNDNIDYYKFSIPADGKVILNMNNTTGQDLRYTFYDSSFNASYSNKTNNKVTEQVQLVGGTYYLAIKREYESGSGAAFGSYSFSLSHVVTIPVAPAITSVSNSGKRKMSVKWSVVKGADGYELQYGKGAGLKGCVTKSYDASRSGASFTKLTKKKRYYVRMRSYKYVNNQKKYSSWGQKSSVVIKK